MSSWRDRITVDPRILVGKPAIKPTRIAVELVVGPPAAGRPHEQIPGICPALTDDDIRAWPAYASEVLHCGKVYPLEPV